jgi:hypothetical protein
MALHTATMRYKKSTTTMQNQQNAGKITMKTDVLSMNPTKAPVLPRNPIYTRQDRISKRSNEGKAPNNPNSNAKKGRDKNERKTIQEEI